MFDFLDQLGFGSFEMPKFDFGSLFGSAEGGASFADRLGFGMLDPKQWDIASTPGKALDLRYSDAFKGSVGAQNYLAPLEHFDFTRDAARSNPFSGAFAAGASVPYNALKMAPGPLRELPKLFGTGAAATSGANLSDILWSGAGAVKGAGEWAKGTFDTVFK